MNGGFDILENAWATVLVLLFFGGSIFVILPMPLL